MHANHQQCRAQVSRKPFPPTPLLRPLTVTRVNFSGGSDRMRERKDVVTASEISKENKPNDE